MGYIHRTRVRETCTSLLSETERPHARRNRRVFNLSPRWRVRNSRAVFRLTLTVDGFEGWICVPEWQMFPWGFGNRDGWMGRGFFV